MSSRLIQIVESFNNQHVLLVGDLILDRYIYGDAERISPEAPVPVLRAVDRHERAGGAGNVAACLCALGMRVTCCGVVGEDHAGNELIDLLTDCGVNCEGVIRAPGRPTITKTRLVGLAQHRHRQQLLRFDEEDTRPVDLECVKKLQGVIASALTDADVVCIEDYQKGLLSEGLVQHIVAMSRKRERMVLADPAPIEDYRKYNGVTLVTPNRMEFCTALGERLTTPAAVANRVDDLRRRIGADAVVVTLDRDGAVLGAKDMAPMHIPTRPRAVYDNTGAGDAVLSMLAAALSAGADYVEAVQLANIAGGLEVEKFGCVPIPREEVLADLRIENRRLAGKLRGVDDLLGELSLHRDRGQTVVFTNGCFDLVHPGHVDLLRRCAEQGDILVVGLNSDASVRAQNKGDGRPVFNERERAAILGAMECVDYVAVFSEPTPETLIKRVRPDVLVKGQDWAHWVCGREFVESYGGKVVLLPLMEGYSTTRIIDRIRQSS